MFVQFRTIKVDQKFTDFYRFLPVTGICVTAWLIYSILDTGCRAELETAKDGAKMVQKSVQPQRRQAAELAE